MIHLAGVVDLTAITELLPILLLRRWRTMFFTPSMKAIDSTLSDWLPVKSCESQIGGTVKGVGGYEEGVCNIGYG